MQTHRGRIKLADGDEVDVDLEMTDESIRLATDATEIGTWARAEFHIVPLGDGVFEIVIDGDRVAFEPLDVEPFEISMLGTNGADPDRLAVASGREEFGVDAGRELFDRSALAVDATGSNGAGPADTDGAPHLRGVETSEDGEEESFEGEASEIIESVESPGGTAGRADTGPGDGFEVIDLDDDPLDAVDVGEGHAGIARQGELDGEELDDSAVADGEVEHQPIELADVAAIDSTGGWTGRDVFFDDPEGAAGSPVEGDEVAAWTLITPDHGAEGRWSEREDAGGIVPTGGGTESTAHEGVAPPESKWDEPDTQPEWPGFGYEHVDDSDVVDAPSAPRIDQAPSDDLAFGDATDDGAEMAESAIPVGVDAPTPHPASADTRAPSKGGESQESGATTGWNYEVLARALAELEESPGTQGEPESPPEDASRPADPVNSGGGRFGGSSMERLSAAVGSLRDRRLTPAEEALAEAAGEQAEETSSVADGILASQRSLRQSTVVQKITWDLVRKVGAGVLLGIGIAAVVVLAPDAWDVLTRETDTPVTTIQPGEVDPTTVTTTVTAVSTTTTTAAPEATTTTTEPVPVQTVFDLPAPQFVQTWNDVARPIDEVLTFAALPPIGEFENEFFSHLSMLGVVGPDGTVDRFSLVIDPTGPANSDRLGIQSLGVALKVMDPGSTGSSRAALLRSLGLDVNEPNLGGIDSSLDVDGIRYSLRYDSESVTLTLSVAPIGPGGE
jgi:hypothetical protein